MNEEKDIKENVERREAAGQEAKELEKVIYMGPTIKNVAVQGTVYEGGLPPELEEKAKKNPALQALIIPLKDLPKANAELATPGSALDVLYKKAEAMQE